MFTAPTLKDKVSCQQHDKGGVYCGIYIMPLAAIRRGGDVSD